MDILIFTSDPRRPDAIDEGVVASTLRIVSSGDGTLEWASADQNDTVSAASREVSVPATKLPPEREVSRETMSTEVVASNVESGFVRKVVRSATIGTTYPLGESVARMHFTGSSTTEMDMAVSASSNAGFRISGNRSVSSGFSQTWNHSTSVRAFRVGVQYGLYRYCSRVYGTCYSYSWRPIQLTGGAATQSFPASTRPDFRHCEPVSFGTWSRSRSDGRTYRHSAGVGFRDVVGFDLGVSRGYSASSRTDYEIRGSRRKEMCGNNTFPSVAGKVMERFRW